MHGLRIALHNSGAIAIMPMTVRSQCYSCHMQCCVSTMFESFGHFVFSVIINICLPIQYNVFTD